MVGARLADPLEHREEKRGLAAVTVLIKMKARNSRRQNGRFERIPT